MSRGQGRRAGALAIVVAAFAVLAAPAGAATFPVACGDVTGPSGLRAAIAAANGAPDADTIVLGPGSPCTYSLPNSVATAGGPNGLPLVTSPLTIEGNGATIQRATTPSNLNLRLLFGSGTRLTLNDLVLTGGRLTGSNQNGAAVGGFNADLELNRVTAAANSVSIPATGPGSGGGAIAAANGSITIVDSSIFFNSAQFGGGIYAANVPVHVSRSSIFSNFGSVYGGAAVLQGATSELENVTVAGNATDAGSTVDWGGVAVIPFGSALGRLDVRYSTFSDNGRAGSTAPGGQLIAWNNGGPAEIHLGDTIVADRDGSGAGPACVEFLGGDVIDEGGNIEWPTTSCPGALNEDPRLAALAVDPGESTATMRPLPTSPAIDTGEGDCPATDQRGVPRPDGDGCDVGAYETPAPETTADADSPTNDPQVTFESDASPVSFECRIDGGSWDPCTSPLVLSQLDEGQHTVEVRAISSQGYADPSPAAVTFVVDRTPPEVAIDPVASPTNDRTVEVAFSVDDASASATCQVDDAAPVDCDSPFTTGELADGEHTVTVRATDDAGNTGSDSVTFVVDASPPQTTITGGPSGTIHDSSATFSFTSPEAGSTFTCQLDDGPAETCTSPRTYNGFAPGRHTFRVFAVDAAGNADPTPATRTFTYQRCALLRISINAITICV